MPSVRALLLAAIAVLVAAPVGAARRDPDKLPAIKIRDLHYGDVLFYVFQGPDKDLDAITRLEAYDHWNRIPHHEAESRLLLGGLYLSLGLHNEAGAIFEQLLTRDVPLGVRNRAWYYLGQVWYARGYLDKAEHALRQVQGKLPPQLDAEREHLLANVLIREGRYPDAVQMLESWKGPRDWMAYAQFNLGVALVRQGQLDQAATHLGAVGRINTQSPELLALRDRANLALGFAYIQADRRSRTCDSMARTPTRRCSEWAGRTPHSGTTAERSCPGSRCASAACSMQRCRSPTSRCLTPTPS